MKYKVDKRKRRKDATFDKSLDENNPNLFWQLLRRTPVYILAIDEFEKGIENEDSDIATWYNYLNRNTTTEMPRDLGRRLKKSIGIGKVKDIFEKEHPSLARFLAQFGSLMQFPLSFTTTNIPISYLNFFDAFEPILTKNVDLSKKISNAVLSIHLNTIFPMNQIIEETILTIESHYKDQKKAPLLEKIEKMYSEDFEMQLKAWDHRVSGLSWKQIAQTLNVSKGTAENGFKRVQQLIDSITEFVES